MSNQIVKALEDAAKKIGKSLAEDAGKAVKDFYHSAGTKLKTVAKNTAEADAKHKGALDDILNGAEKDAGKDLPHDPKLPGGGHPGGEHPGEPGPGRVQVQNPDEAARADDAICPGGEPVDMATGRMFIDQVDTTLPGSLPLLFTRNHESGYLAGRWMGPRWVCTFDERLEIDTEGLVHIRADRRTQAYPHPDPGETVEATTGERRHLRLAKGGYHLHDRTTGLTREFTTAPGGTEALLTKVRNRQGHHYTLAYDEHGTPQSITHSGGYHLLVTTDSGRITALRLAGGAPDGGDTLITRYGYTDGHLTSVYNSSGKPMRFANDPTGRILSWTDRTNSQYLYQYDEFNRVTDEGGADGSLRFHFTYDEPDPETGLKLHTETNAHGHTTTYTVNERAQITAITDPLGNTSTYERDEYHRLLTETDPLGRTTRHEYDGAGDLIRVTRPNGEQTTATYGAGLSLPEAITEPGGTTWRQAYDALGRRVSATDPLGNVTTFGYDSRGHLSTVTDPAGDTTSLRCDDAGMAVETLDPTGAVTRIERDAFGRPVTVTDPAGQVTRMTWTIEGKPESRTGPDGTVERWTYDGEGNCLAHTDQLGRTTTFEYTHFELLAARTGPDGSRITFTHDSCMQLVAVGNATGQQWTYTYDPAGRVIAETDFHGRALAYRLDAAGQLIEHTDAFGSLTSYDRDELGRVITKEAHGRSTTFGYDQAGNVIRAVNQDADVRRTFDPLGSLLSETVNGRTITFDRDVLGRRTRRTTPSGHVTARSYDTAGRLTGLDTPGGTIDFSYDAAGREQQRTFDDRLTLTSHWNSSDLLSAQELRTSQQHVLQRRTYAYREDGSLSGVDDRLTGKRTFELDLAGRVTGVHAADWSEAYAYDLNGNLTSAEWPATAANEPAVGARSYSGTQLTSAGRVRYEYDSAGRMTLRQAVRLSRKPDTWRYTWDSDNRLSEVTTPDGTRWRYRYDPFGRRIAKERLAADGTTVEEVTTFTWDGPVLAEQTTQASYLPGPHTISWDHQDLHPLAQTETITVPIADDQDQARVDQRFFAIVTDLVGTPTELVDPATESIAWQAGSTLWGQTAWPSASTTYTPLRFPGQYFDPETRLNYNHHRYYDPETARYITPDPLGLTPAPNPDTYVHNPHTWSDPLGLSPHANPRPTGPDPNGHIVYRALAKGEDPSVGLTARDPNNLAVRPLSHVAGKKRTPWISLSKNPDIAFDKYNQGNGVVAIDLRRIPYKYTDISDGPFPSSRRHSAYARKDSEVLAWRFIPPEAIVGIW